MKLDQATTLRLWADKELSKASLTERCRSWAIVSGKGGVGKTSFVVNVSSLLALEGYKVLVVDADLSLGNVDVALGLRPYANLSHVLSGEKTIRDVLMIGPNNVKILPAGSGMKQLAQVDEDKMIRLLDDFAALERNCDIMLFDVGAGIGDNVIQFSCAADEVVVVTTPDPTAMADAYATIKVIVQNKPQANINIVVNMARSTEEALQTYERIRLVCQKFLKIAIKNWGYLSWSEEIAQSVRNQRTFIENTKLKQEQKQLQKIAGYFRTRGQEGESSVETKSFFAKLFSFNS